MSARWSKRGFPPKGGVSRLRSLAPILAGAAALLVGLTLAACGGSSNSADVPPHSTPEITPPTNTQAESEATPTTSTSTVATTSKSGSGSSSTSRRKLERRTLQLQRGGHGQRKHDQLRRQLSRQEKPSTPEASSGASGGTGESGAKGGSEATGGGGSSSSPTGGAQAP